MGTEGQGAVEALLERARRWEPALEDALWRRYERTLSATAIRVLGEYGSPSERLVDRLLQVVQTAGERHALRGLERMAKRAPELRLRIREKLAELLHTGSFPKSLRADELRSLVDALGKGA